MQASFSGRTCAPERALLQQRGRRTCVNVVAKTEYDSSVRVKGSVKRVFKYVADFSHLPEWYPGVVSVTRTRGEGISLKNQFTVERIIMKMQHTSTYEIIELEEGRKVVYSAQSPVHTALHQLYFMSDPTDRNFTNVRYIKRIQLRNLANALGPLVTGTLSKIPEQSMAQLAKLLSSPDTPLASIKLDPEEEAEEIRASKPTSSWSWQSVWEGLGLGPMPGAPASPLGGDLLGYYSILGLEVRRAASYTTDDIKAAYRKAAMEMHPDKVSIDDSVMQQSASLKFQRLQKAYSVLRNPEHKKMYDAGQLVEELVQ